MSLVWGHTIMGKTAGLSYGVHIIGGIPRYKSLFDMRGKAAQSESFA